jgi:hypothetical protein
MGKCLPRGENVFSVNNSTKDLSDAGIDTAILSVGRPSSAALVCP